MATIFVVQSTTENNDTDKTIEAQAELIKQDIINKFYELNPETIPNTEQERIVVTAGVVID